MEHFSHMCFGNTDTSLWGGTLFGSSSSSPTAPTAAVAPGTLMCVRNSGNTVPTMRQQQQYSSSNSNSNSNTTAATTITHSASDRLVDPIQLIPENRRPPFAKLEGVSSKPRQLPEFQSCPSGQRGRCDGSPSTSDVDAIKAQIVSHPQYPSLLETYMDCQKVGAPPEVMARLTAVAGEYEARRRTAMSSCGTPNDPELDKFMEAYYDMLVKYREELTRPFQEAMDFLRSVESQLNVLTNGSAHFFSEEKCEGVGSLEEDQDASGGETEHSEIDPHAENQELKQHLLKKYSGYLGGLKHELSKKKKKGKLPKEARQKLINWWDLHNKWPYPSESEKVALAESTGLGQKQINNWFINQRKRHWKPSEDMQFVVMDGFNPQNAAPFHMDGHFFGDGMYRLGP